MKWSFYQKNQCLRTKKNSTEVQNHRKIFWRRWFFSQSMIRNACRLNRFTKLLWTVNKWRWKSIDDCSDCRNNWKYAWRRCCIVIIRNNLNCDAKIQKKRLKIQKTKNTVFDSLINGKSVTVSNEDIYESVQSFNDIALMEHFGRSYQQLNELPMYLYKDILLIMNKQHAKNKAEIESMKNTKNKR